MLSERTAGADTIPGYRATAWYGLLVPRAPPPRSRRSCTARCARRCRARDVIRRLRTKGRAVRPRRRGLRAADPLGARALGAVIRQAISRWIERPRGHAPGAHGPRPERPGVSRRRPAPGIRPASGPPLTSPARSAHAAHDCRGKQGGAMRMGRWGVARLGRAGDGRRRHRPWRRATRWRNSAGVGRCLEASAALPIPPMMPVSRPAAPAGRPRAAAVRRRLLPLRGRGAGAGARWKASPIRRSAPARARCPACW